MRDDPFDQDRYPDESADAPPRPRGPQRPLPDRLIAVLVVASLAVTTWISISMSEGNDWGIFQFLLVGCVGFALSFMALLAIFGGAYAFYLLAIGAPERGTIPSVPWRIPKPGLTRFLADTASGPADYGFAGVIVVSVTSVVTLLVAFLVVQALPEAKSVPKMILAVPGLIAGGFCYLVVGMIIHACMPAQVTMIKRPMANATLSLLLAGGAVGGIVWYAISAAS